MDEEIIDKYLVKLVSVNNEIYRIGYYLDLANFLDDFIEDSERKKIGGLVSSLSELKESACVQKRALERLISSLHNVNTELRNVLELVEDGGLQYERYALYEKIVSKLERESEPRVKLAIPEEDDLRLAQRLQDRGYSESFSYLTAMDPSLYIFAQLEMLRYKYEIADNVPYPYKCNLPKVSIDKSL